MVMKKLTSKTPGLKAGQRRVLDALPTSKTMAEAAKTAGVTAVLTRRWLMHDEAFRSEVKAIRREAVAEARGQLQHLAMDAVDGLGELVRNNELTTATRMTAIRVALDFAYRAAELDQLEEIEARLGRVEALLDDLPVDPPAAEVHWIEQGKTKVIRPK